MPNLFIMRHGEAANHYEDFNRPLTIKGSIDVGRIGEELLQFDLNKTLIISSTSVRTRETTSILLEKLQAYEITVFFEDKGYLATAEVWFKYLEGINVKEFNTCIIVGHNPGISQLVKNITGETIYMTPATCVKVNLLINEWNEIFAGVGNVNQVCTP
ncbi:MAG: hypothetical protein COA49_08315 [Bacteroidetes bacterium]|nr:MAG: hypothetical protein COA49_08315 [Bacteroidota bacterium]